MIRYLSAEQVVLIHERILALFGGENGYHLRATPDEIIALVLDIETKKSDIGKIASWLAGHSYPA